MAIILLLLSELSLQGLISSSDGVNSVSEKQPTQRLNLGPLDPRRFCSLSSHHLPLLRAQQSRPSHLSPLGAQVSQPSLLHHLLGAQASLSSQLQTPHYCQCLRSILSRLCVLHSYS